MGACWEIRGCDDEMQGRCPHNVPGETCPAECCFTACERSRHAVCTDLSLLLNPERDFDAAVKDACRICEYFLVSGPSVAADKANTRQQGRQGNPNRFLL